MKQLELFNLPTLPQRRKRLVVFEAKEELNLQAHYAAQKKKVLAWLKKGHTITKLEAILKWKCLHVGARIFELRREGYQISTDMVQEGRTRYAVYKLEKI